jgi:hypothetical protein
MEGKDRDQDRVSEMLPMEVLHILGLEISLRPCHLVVEWERRDLSPVFPLYLRLLLQQ